MSKKYILLLSLFVFAVSAQPGKTLAETDQNSEVGDATLSAIDQQQKESIAVQVKRAESDKAEKTEKILREFQKTQIPSMRPISEETTGLEKEQPSLTALSDQELPSESPAVSDKEQTINRALAVNNVSNAEMKSNWDDLFSKKETAKSLVHTVQLGESLYLLALKNRTTVELIKKLNGLKNDTIYAGSDLKIYTGSFAVLIDKSENTLTLFADEKPIKQYPVSTGKDNSTPSGDFKIAIKLVDPVWFKTGAIYPPGSPDNVLGTRWLGFDKPTYGIHGTVEPEKIGKQVSEGCVRMLNADVEELYSLVPTGTPVIIQD